ncbi:GMC oxidoreductase [Acinetobacter baumannii]
MRIADASVMPLLISGNTNAPSMMVGERAAGFMLEENA